MFGSNNVSFILVFLEGLLSFFSPCVIPLIPVYMGYLAGGGKKVDDNGAITYDRNKVFLHTMFFALGISFSFFILGLSFTTLGRFFNRVEKKSYKIYGESWWSHSYYHGNHDINRMDEWDIGVFKFNQ